MILITKSYLQDLAAKGMSVKEMCAEIKNAYGSPISSKDVRLHLGRFNIAISRKRKPVYEFVDDTTNHTQTVENDPLYAMFGSEDSIQVTN